MNKRQKVALCIGLAIIGVIFGATLATWQIYATVNTSRIFVQLLLVAAVTVAAIVMLKQKDPSKGRNRPEAGLRDVFEHPDERANDS